MKRSVSFFKKRAWPWMDPVVEETSPSQHFLHGIWVGGKSLIAIYLPNAAFDTHDEPASFDCHLLRRQGFFSPHFAQHRLLRLCISGLRFFLCPDCALWGNTNPTQAPQLCHCREIHRASHTAASSKGGRHLTALKKLSETKGIPRWAGVPGTFCFPTTWCRIRRWMNICVY